MCFQVSGAAPSRASHQMLKALREATPKSAEVENVAVQ